MPADPPTTTREQSLLEQFELALTPHGQQVRIVVASHLSDLAESIRQPHEQGEFDQAFYDEYLTMFKFSLPEEMPDAQSLIVVATPQPPIPVIFHYQGKEYDVWVPPTYAGYQTVPPQVVSTLQPIIEAEGYRIIPANRIPFKRTVVSSGLGRYGRNNICYIDGIGSFFGLNAFFSDMPCDVDHWQEPRTLDRCSTCSACVKMCPTGAIAPDRFLLHAERCLTFHNEKSGDVPFPEWIKKSAHNSLIGCMICQAVCPENVVVKKWLADPVEFSERETELILGGQSPEILGGIVIDKLTKIGLNDSLHLLPRNLSVMLS
jgi:epoxyqueuosine reductase